MPKNPSRLLFMAFLVVAIAGCPATKGGAPSVSGANSLKLGIISNNSAKISGTVLGPSGIISNNSAKIISNNSGKIISNNSGKYLVQGYQAIGVPNAVVYLTRPDERFYTDENGLVLFAVTDQDGRYCFDKAPGGEDVIVTVVGAHDRRMVGFIKSKKGETQALNVSLATTYVTELLRDQAKELGKSLGDFYDPPKLEKIIALTNQLIENGKLGQIDVEKGLPDLTVRNIPALRNEYLLAFATDNPELIKAWFDLTGQTFLLVTPVETGLTAGTIGWSVSCDPVGGDVFFSGSTDSSAPLVRLRPGTPPLNFTRQFVNCYLYGPDAGWSIYEARSLRFKDGRLYFADGANAFIASLDPNGPEILPPDQMGLPNSFQTLLENGRSFDELVPDPLIPFTYEGRDYPWRNFLEVSDLTDFYQFDRAKAMPRFEMSGFDFASDGSIYLCDSWDDVILHTTPFSKKFEVIAGRLGKRGFSGDGGPASQALLGQPSDLVIRGDFLYFSDLLNNRIRKIDLKDNTIQTVAGCSPEGGFSGDGGLATKAVLNIPRGLAFDQNGSLYFADRLNQRIRKIDRNGIITTVAGTLSTDRMAVSGKGLARWTMIGEPYELAFDKEGNLLVASELGLLKIWLSVLPQEEKP